MLVLFWLYGYCCTRSHAREQICNVYQLPTSFLEVQAPVSCRKEMLHLMPSATVLRSAASSGWCPRREGESLRLFLAMATFLTGLLEVLNSPYSALKCTEPSGSGLSCPALPACPPWDLHEQWEGHD